MQPQFLGNPRKLFPDLYLGEQDCITALRVILDQVDYTSGACRPNEMVGAVLPKEIIEMARKALALAKTVEDKPNE